MKLSRLDVSTSILFCITPSWGGDGGAGLMPLASRTSHTRVHLGRASPSGMTCLVQCVQRNQISLRNRQLASINTIYIFLYIYLQLYINFPKTTSPLSPTALSTTLSHIHTHSTCPRMFVAPRRQSGVAHYTSPRRPTVNHLPRPRRPSAAVAPTCTFILIFHQMTLIFPWVPIVFTVSSFEYWMQTLREQRLKVRKPSFPVIPWRRVKVEHCLESLQSSRPHWLNRSA